MPGDGELQQQQQQQQQQFIQVNVEQNQDQMMNMNQQIQNDPLMMNQNQNVQVEKEEEKKLEKDVKENMPESLESSIQEPLEEQKLESNVSIRGIFHAYGDFTEISERDSEKMKAVKKAMIKYSENTKGGLQNYMTDIENLDSLISACRWYNVSRWSLRANARARQRKVKEVLEIAKRERSRLAALDKKEEAEFEKYRKEKQRSQHGLGEKVKSLGPELIHNGPTFDSTIPLGTARKWAAFKSYTFGFVGRNILNLGMGAIAGAAWLVSYPFAAAIGAVGSLAGKKELTKFYRGFNIKIPRPMSPQGWYNYYLYGQRHATSDAMLKRGDLEGIGEFILRSAQYNLWHPLKHVLTLDVEHLSGGGYVEPHAEVKKKKAREGEMIDKYTTSKSFYDDDNADDGSNDD